MAAPFVVLALGALVLIEPLPVALVALVVLLLVRHWRRSAERPSWLRLARRPLRPALPSESANEGPNEGPKEGAKDAAKDDSGAAGPLPLPLGAGPDRDAVAGAGADAGPTS